jgi:hypothetical protein
MTGGRRLAVVTASAICGPALNGNPILAATIPQNFIKSRREISLSFSFNEQ